jgi:hypothetical protein
MILDLVDQPVTALRAAGGTVMVGMNTAGRRDLMPLASIAL